MPIAGQTGLITPLTSFVLDAAIRQVRAWKDAGLEITESMLMADPAHAEATLTRLSQIGLTLSVDDFGTGYSSLANLKRLPVDTIKIDKSFVMEMAVDASDAAIVRSTIDLAHNLGPPAARRGGDADDPRAWHGARERSARAAHRARPRSLAPPSASAHEPLQAFTEVVDSPTLGA